MNIILIAAYVLASLAAASSPPPPASPRSIAIGQHAQERAKWHQREQDILAKRRKIVRSSLAAGALVAIGSAATALTQHATGTLHNGMTYFDVGTAGMAAGICAGAVASKVCKKHADKASLGRPAFDTHPTLTKTVTTADHDGAECASCVDAQ